MNYETKFIKKEWVTFKKAYIPEAASKDQVNDMKIAFFTGATVLFSMLLRLVSPGEEVKERDLLLMKSLDDELREFRKFVLAETNPLEEHSNVAPNT